MVHNTLQMVLDGGSEREELGDPGLPGDVAPLVHTRFQHKRITYSVGQLGLLQEHISDIEFLVRPHQPVEVAELARPLPAPAGRDLQSLALVVLGQVAVVLPCQAVPLLERAPVGQEDEPSPLEFVIGRPIIPLQRLLLQSAAQLRDDAVPVELDEVERVVDDLDVGSRLPEGTVVLGVHVHADRHHLVQPLLADKPDEVLHLLLALARPRRTAHGPSPGR